MSHEPPSESRDPLMESGPTSPLPQDGTSFPSTRCRPSSNRAPTGHVAASSIRKRKRTRPPPRPAGSPRTTTWSSPSHSGGEVDSRSLPFHSVTLPLVSHGSARRCASPTFQTPRGVSSLDARDRMAGSKFVALERVEYRYRRLVAVVTDAVGRVGVVLAGNRRVVDEKRPVARPARRRVAVRPPRRSPSRARWLPRGCRPSRAARASRRLDPDRPESS